MKSLSLPILLTILSLFPCHVQNFDILIQNANIIDVASGTVIKNQDIGICGQKIARITPATQLTSQTSTTKIDASNKYIMPGLWDMHVHLYFPDKEYLKMYLAHGVVGVREMSGKRLHWRDSTNQDAKVPRMLIGSGCVDGPCPWFESDTAIRNCEEVRMVVRKAKAKGYDFMKLLSLVPRDQYMALTDECKKLNMEFSGHIPSSVNIIEAAKRGQKTNEHLKGFFDACSTRETLLRNRLDSLLVELSKQEKMNGLMEMQIMGCETRAFWSFNQEKADSVINELSKYDMFQCPTLSVMHDFAKDRVESIYTDQRYMYFPPFLKKVYRPGKRELEHVNIIRRELKLQERLLLQMHKKGIKILAGSDQGCAGYNLHDELEYLVKVGFTNAEAIKTATINPAIYMDKENLMGSVAPSKLADLIILNSNPLDNIENTRDISLVLFKGELLNPHQLKEEVKKKNEEITEEMNQQNWW